MARKVKNLYRKMRKEHPDLHDALSKTAGMSSTEAYNYLKKKKVKPILSSAKLRAIVNKEKKKSGIPVKITKRMPRGYKTLEGAAVEYDDKVHVRIHPVVRYGYKEHAEDLIGHELDHAKVMKRVVENRKKRRK